MVDKYKRHVSRFPDYVPTSIHGKMFVKDEGYFKTRNMKPRLVMEVKDLRSIAPIAPFCNALSDYWHWLDSTVIPPLIFLTGLNRVVVDTWYRRWCADKAHAVENDFSEFESRVSTDALDLEFDTYDLLGFSHLRPHFESQKKMILTGTGWRFTRHGGRMSGVPNTSLGNSIINFSLHYNFFTEHGFKPGRDYAMAVNGDDNVIFCNVEVFECCKNHMEEFFSNLSMKAEIVLHADPTKANFCSSSFGTLPNGKVCMAIHPFRAMAKIGKFSSIGCAGPETVVQLLRDYSSTPNFWPLHVFSRYWLDQMGYSHEDAPSLPYDCCLTPSRLRNIFSLNKIQSDGTWIIRPHWALRSCFSQEGLLEDPSKEPNFILPTIITGLPPQWGKPGWIRRARAIREKLLAFWRKSDYSSWTPRLDHVAWTQVSTENYGPQQEPEEF